MKETEQWLIDFGSRLKAEREKQKLTQHALAVKAKTKQDYIAQIERGLRNPSLKTLMNILLALDISADHLIYGSNEKKYNEIDGVMKEFNDFMTRRSIEEISSYYEIVRFLSKYM
ncbi:MAG: helix-turn-helix domain-containing protein [Defluviitaleaceae bacterium]|nr:helix-turn-helix domain-containing protein [Defluviitaleaceae bacterium]